MIEKFLNALARVGEPGRWVVAGLVCDPVLQRDERLVRHVVYLLVVIDVDLEVPQANAVLERVERREAFIQVNMKFRVTRVDALRALRHTWRECTHVREHLMSRLHWLSDLQLKCKKNVGRR